MGFSPEELINIQKPFSYFPNKSKKFGASKGFLVPKKEFLGSNIAGMCTICGFQVQKVRKGQQCKYCGKYGYESLIAFPRELKPWIVVPTSLSVNRKFICYTCGNSYSASAFFASICNHKKHPFGAANVSTVCRLCCPRVSKKLLLRIHDYWVRSYSVEAENLLDTYTHTIQGNYIYIPRPDQPPPRFTPPVVFFEEDIH